MNLDGAKRRWRSKRGCIAPSLLTSSARRATFPLTTLNGLPSLWAYPSQNFSGHPAEIPRGAEWRSRHATAIEGSHGGGQCVAWLLADEGWSRPTLAAIAALAASSELAVSIVEMSPLALTGFEPVPPGDTPHILSPRNLVQRGPVRLVDGVFIQGDDLGLRLIPTADTSDARWSVTGCNRSRAGCNHGRL